MEKGYNVNTETTSKHYSKVIVDEDGQTVMVMKDDLIQSLNLIANEILEWNVGKDEIVIKRLKFIDNSSSDKQ